MELVRIPSQELENIWGLIEKDVKQSLLYSGQLATPEFVFETAKKESFKYGFCGINNKKQVLKNILV